ncbi:MAG: HigA family addiction module antitoxin [Trueperaceae bacterium]
MNNLKPMHNPAHPGEVLKELHLEPLGLSVTAAAKALGVSRKHLSIVVNGHARVTAEMALRLSKALGTSVGLWLDMQQNYDVWHASQSVDLSDVRVLGDPSAELSR